MGILKNIKISDIVVYVLFATSLKWSYTSKFSIDQNISIEKLNLRMKSPM